ncbi:molybdopterin converting factor subunit 1 [Psychromonas sp. 14N.309.X.WAT.B.A12]|uniref:molybdopterin converting factor subunit 1 n=1 Tax=unclassified Psychromonas TaxID=2614957 RepID=UPI0025B21985|nr:molybdopterin converting factor subunit 1 [Psychromonas sp. 14N.309.X.WAT.B.A12]MDN2663200.1 molybdopterin converting factor subunit 1 [Psychromonas sp. 14N.309.X.WAT.B.A12]
MITVLFFAKLSEQLGVRSLQVEWRQAQDTDQLFQYLTEYKAEWAVTLTSQPCLKAVNQAMVNNNIALKEGDEVAFFPPVTGG